MNGCEKFDDCITEEFQSFIVSDIGLGFRLLAQTGHDVDKRVDAALACVHVVDAPVAVFRLPDAAVGERVARVIRIGTEILAIRWMCQC